MYKNIILLLLFTIPSFLFGSDKWIADNFSKIKNVEGLPFTEKYDSLKVYLNFKKEADAFHRIMTPDQQLIYNRAQDVMISTPGHAEYFAQKVADARAKTPDTYGYAYIQVYSEATRVLKQLPSPETVQVMGRLLEDTSDVLPTNMKRTEALRILWEIAEKEERSPLFSNSASGLALEVLGDLGIRGLPAFDFSPEGMQNDFRNACLQWWREVKSGQRTFSFFGQAVEYRFKQDGTWETLALANPPDDAPKSAGSSPAVNGRPAKEPAISPDTKPAGGYRWPWVSGGALAVMALFLWLRGRLRSKAA